MKTTKKKFLLATLSKFIISATLGCFLYGFLFRSVMNENMGIFRQGESLVYGLMFGLMLILAIVLSWSYHFMISRGASIRPMEYVCFVAFPFCIITELTIAAYYNVTIGMLLLGFVSVSSQLLVWGVILHMIYSAKKQ